MQFYLKISHFHTDTDLFFWKSCHFYGFLDSIGAKNTFIWKFWDKEIIICTNFSSKLYKEPFYHSSQAKSGKQTIEKLWSTTWRLSRNHFPQVPKVRCFFKAYNCRPQDYLLLETRAAKTKYGKRTFDYAAPSHWNALPLEVRMEENIDKFKGQIKTMLFDGTEELKQRALMYNWVKTVISVCVQ